MWQWLLESTQLGWVRASHAGEGTGHRVGLGTRWEGGPALGSSPWPEGLWGVLGFLRTWFTWPHVASQESTVSGPAVAQNILLRTILGMWRQNPFLWREWGIASLGVLQLVCSETIGITEERLSPSFFWGRIGKQGWYGQAVIKLPWIASNIIETKNWWTCVVNEVLPFLGDPWVFEPFLYHIMRTNIFIKIRKH